MFDFKKFLGVRLGSFLGVGEKKTGINSRGTGALLKVVAGLVNKGGAFLLIPFLTKVMSPAEYGMVSLLVTFSGILGLLTFGSFVAYQSNYHKLDSNNGDLGSYVFSFTVFQVILVLVVVVLALLGQGQRLFALLSGDDSYVSVRLIFAAILLGSLQIFGSTFETYYSMSGRLAYSAVVSVVGFFVGSLATVFFVMRMADKTSGRIYGLAIGGLMTLLMAIPFIKKIYSFNFRMSYLKDAIIVGYPLMLNGVVYLAISSSDRVLIANILGIDAVGIFAFSFSISSLVSVISTAVSASYCSDYYRLVAENERDRLAKVAGVYLYASLLAALIAAVWLPVAIRMFFNEKYQTGAALVSMQCGGLGIYVLFSMLTQEYNSRKKTIWIPVFSVGVATVSIGMNWVLLPVYGLVAAALTTLVSYSLLAVVVLVVANRLFDFVAFDLKNTIFSVVAYFLLIVTMSILDGVTFFLLSMKIVVTILALGCGFWFYRDGGNVRNSQKV